MEIGLMKARSVQISIDEDLLAQIDRRTKMRAEGRSAFIRRALRAYLAAERRREIDAAYARGYGSKAAAALDDDLSALMAEQSWPQP
jgi:metal-responsive CopG/Arc/MetJ family transcriptional regulator